MPGHHRSLLHLPRQILRLVPAALAAAALALVALAGAAHAAGNGSAAAHHDVLHVDVAQFASDVSPASALAFGDAVDRAQADGAAALVVQLDTFGGDLASLETIREKELTSTLPIVIYVSPSGGHADSAGALLSLAAPVVAMAPDTRIGSASPVDASGQDLSSTEKAKTTSALVAEVTGDQQKYGRNVPLAVAMVTQAASYDDQQAVSDSIVNLDAASLTDLLGQLQGYPVTLANGTATTLNLAGAQVTPLQPTVRVQLEGLLLDPTVLFLLFAVAAVCIYLELSHPGAIVPGTVGVIALLLFLFGAGSLQPNWAGLALMLLAIVLLAVDVRAPTHGVLTAGALVSLIVGSLLFFNTGPSDQAISPWLVAGLAVGVGGVSLVVLRYALRARHAKVDTGREALLGQVGVVIEPLTPKGRVRVLGEDWAAALAAPDSGVHATDTVEAGRRVRVIAVEGLHLQVWPEP
jgi:membrane-bound serine protease (ClpP class)